MIKLASWNVNSIKVRLPQVIDWLESSQTDILALQETKVTDDQFPKEAFQARGYYIDYIGQKAYNGVALISKYPITDVLTHMPTFADPQKRVIAGTVNGIRVINLYVPNGAAVDSDKYEYKMNWLQHAYAFIQQELIRYPKLAVVGDFNIAPEDKDVHAPEEWEGSVLVSPLEREAFAKLLSLGLQDSFRLFTQDEKMYSWWDYRMHSFRRNRGLRIDHILLSRDLLKPCLESCIDKQPRTLEKPSDHAPVWTRLAIDLE